VQRDRSAEPRINDRRRGFLRLKGPSTTATRAKNTETLPSSRVRQQRPHQIPLEEPRTTGPFHSGTSAFSWVILMGGMLLAVAGVVHASWPSPESQNSASASISEDVLNKQIAELKAELDRERAEKTELIENIATTAKPPAPEPQSVLPAVQKVTQAVAKERNAAPAQAQVAELQVPESPADKTADEEESSLPQPMAPSVELMLSDVPVSAVPVETSSGASAPQGFGIHLASFADRTMAERGWELLQRNHPSALGQLKPRVEEAKDDKGNTVFLLIAGPFESEELAAAHCRKINTQVVFCKPRPFNGREITAALPQ
jgi:SPOR domain